MGCLITLNQRLAGESSGGYFVLLGRSATSQVATTTNLPGSLADNGFNILDPLDLGLNGETANDNIVTNNPYTLSLPLALPRFDVLPYNYTLNTTGLTPGFYGVLYVVGDGGQTGNIQNILNNCGAVEAFELEIIPGLGISNSTVDVTFCQDDVPATIDLNVYIPTLTMPFTKTFGLASNHTFGTVNTTTGIITTNSSPPIGVFGYLITLSPVSVVHPSATCCTPVQILVRFTVVAAGNAGTPLTGYACN